MKTTSPYWRLLLGPVWLALGSALFLIPFIAPAAHPNAGVYSGTFSGQDSGIFATFVGDDGVGVLMGYSSTHDNGFYNDNFPVAPNGSFSFTVEGPTAINGTISGSTISGTYSGPGGSGTISGSKHSSTGIQVANAGFYEGSIAGGDTGPLKVILAADGYFGYILLATGGEDGGTDNANSDGEFSGYTVNGVYLDGSFNSLSKEVYGWWEADAETWGTFSASRTRYNQPTTQTWLAKRLFCGADNQLRLLWERQEDFAVSIWNLSSELVKQTSAMHTAASGWHVPPWNVDAGSDGKVRLGWWNNQGGLSLWRLNSSLALAGAYTYGPYDPWWPEMFFIGSDSKERLMWGGQGANDRAVAFWTINASGGLDAAVSYGPYTGWDPDQFGLGGDNLIRCWWLNDNGAAAVWKLSATHAFVTGASYGPYAGWEFDQAEVGRDSKTRLMWKNTNGAISLWTLNSDLVYEGAYGYGPYTGWDAKGFHARPDNKIMMAWEHSTGQVSLWVLGANGAFETGGSYGPYAGWTLEDACADNLGRMYLMWRYTSGGISVWRMSAAGVFEKAANF